MTTLVVPLKTRILWAFLQIVDNTGNGVAVWNREVQKAIHAYIFKQKDGRKFAIITRSVMIIQVIH